MARTLVVVALASIAVGCGSSLGTGGSGGNGASGAGGKLAVGGAGGQAGGGGQAGAPGSGGGVGGSMAGHAGGAAGNVAATGGSTGTGGIGSGGSIGSGGFTGSGGAAGSGNAGASGLAGGGGSAGATGTGGDAGQGGAAGLPGGLRLPLPCIAPLPTGFCLKSDQGDYIGGGNFYVAGGTASVTIDASTTLIGGELTDSTTGGYWDFDFAAPAGTVLLPGLYTQAQRYPFQTGTTPGLSIYGNGAGCNTLTGTFSIEELARDPGTGLSRFSATFEQHCEGAVPALHGVINYQASGTPDPTPTPNQVIQIGGKVSRVAYDPTTNIAYGIDATNRRLAKIDLTSGNVTYAPVVQVPNDVCVDSTRGRLFVVNKGSSLISEYSTGTLADVRDISWTGTDYGASVTQFKIYCTPSELYVVDGAWAPALFTVTGLDDSATPVVTDHTAQVAGVGGLAVNAAGTDLYYWYQYGWDAGELNTYVSRLLTSDLTQVDQSATNLSDFDRDPLDAPLLLDEVDGYVLVKNKIFDALNLTRIIYTLPGTVETYSAADENAYALDAAHGVFATKNYVYSLSGFDVLAPTVIPAADQLFFDSSGTLWMLSISQGTLSGQVVQH
jgi:hypothetical protein